MGKKIEDLDLFVPVSVVSGGCISNAGRPRLPTVRSGLKHSLVAADDRQKGPGLFVVSVAEMRFGGNV